MAVNRKMAWKKTHGRTMHRSGRCTEGHLSNGTNKKKKGRKERKPEQNWMEKQKFISIIYTQYIISTKCTKCNMRSELQQNLAIQKTNLLHTEIENITNGNSSEEENCVHITTSCYIFPRKGLSDGRYGCFGGGSDAFTTPRPIRVVMKSLPFNSSQKVQ